VTIARTEYYDAVAVNNMGTLGAYVTRQNTDAVARAIADIRADYPEYAAAPVQNNDSTALARAA
jgi:hypothetical protein